MFRDTSAQDRVVERASFSVLVAVSEEVEEVGVPEGGVTVTDQHIGIAIGDHAGLELEVGPEFVQRSPG